MLDSSISIESKSVPFCRTYKSCCLEKMRKLAKQLQIDVRNFSEMEKKRKKRRFDVALKVQSPYIVWHYRVPAYDHTLAFADIR